MFFISPELRVRGFAARFRAGLLYHDAEHQEILEQLLSVALLRLDVATELSFEILGDDARRQERGHASATHLEEQDQILGHGDRDVLAVNRAEPEFVQRAVVNVSALPKLVEEVFAKLGHSSRNITETDRPKLDIEVSNPVVLDPDSEIPDPESRFIVPQSEIRHHPISDSVTSPLERRLAPHVLLLAVDLASQVI